MKDSKGKGGIVLGALALMALMAGWVLGRALHRGGPGASRLAASERFELGGTNDVSLRGNGGGLGFVGPWHEGGFNVAGSANFHVEPGPLRPGEPGGHVASDPVGVLSGVQRELARPLGGDRDGPEVWYLSFRIRPEGTLNEGAFFGFFGVTLDEDLFVGKPGGGSIQRWVIEERGGANQVRTPFPVKVGKTDLLVLKMDFHPPGKATLWVNPPAGDVEPAEAAAIHNGLPLSVSRIGLYSTGAFSLSDLRLSSAFAEAVR